MVCDFNIEVFMGNDIQELNELLNNSDDGCFDNDYKNCAPPLPPLKSKYINDLPDINYCQWTTSNGNQFFPSCKTAQELTPGVYDILSNPSIGTYFQQIPVLTTGLIRFPDTNSDKVVDEIQKFWTREALFKSYNLVYKRGIILWGPPGSGKTSVLQFIMRDVVNRNGVVIRFTHPGIFLEGIRKFREIQPLTPIVILMEDVDSILKEYSESDVLNILDGVNQIEKVVFLATTNYPEKLGARIINRPSRFDKRFKIGHPSAESRFIYLEYIIGGKEKVKELKIDLKKWVEDTEGFSIAHLKELFTAVIILGDDYQDAIETLTSMFEEKLDSTSERIRKVGFSSSKIFKDPCQG